MPDDNRKCLCGQVTDAYNEDQTVENYVKLRRSYPKARIDVRLEPEQVLSWVYSGGHGLEDFELDVDLLAEAVSGNRAAICELSISLLELIVPRDKAERRGRTHLVSRGEAISDALVNEIITLMIDGLADADDPSLPPDLVILIRHQTGGVRPSWQKERELRERRGQAGSLALDMAFKGEVPTVRKLAKGVGVNASTIARWFPDGELEKLKLIVNLVHAGVLKPVEPGQVTAAGVNANSYAADVVTGSNRRQA